ncbi:MAG: nitrogen regulation protein NR(II) [Gammaproteobacteria bacterium]|nr:nitrogen regulation protein NR(II) [Gammaproteobacteria bacterium]
MERRIDNRRLLDSLTTAVLLLDADLRIQWINPAAEDLLSISSRKAAGLFLGEVVLNGAEDIDAMWQALGEFAGFTKRFADWRLLHGKSVELDYTITPLDLEGEPFALLEMTSLEYAQRFSRDQTFSSTQATTRELVRGLAHEIKNPLGGLRGAAQLLARELPDGDLSDYTNIIIAEADRLRNLVDRLSGHRKKPALRDINIHEVVERVRNLVEAEIDGRGIRLIRDYDPSIPPLLADPDQLIQAILNIVRNAVQSLASPAVKHELGAITLRTRSVHKVTFGPHLRLPAVSVEVIDNGPGIPERLREAIFFPMVTGSPHGTGLGLPIAHAIVSQHRGLLECESGSGQTCFRLLLPYRRPTATNTTTPNGGRGRESQP